MRRLGWIELEVAEKVGQIGKYRRKHIAAVARCTEHGWQVLNLLGEADAWSVAQLPLQPSAAPPVSQQPSNTAR